jgi:hypothetical protein
VCGGWMPDGAAGPRSHPSDARAQRSRPTMHGRNKVFPAHGGRNSRGAVTMASPARCLIRLAATAPGLLTAPGQIPTLAPRCSRLPTHLCPPSELRDPRDPRGLCRPPGHPSPSPASLACGRPCGAFHVSCFPARKARTLEARVAGGMSAWPPGHRPPSPACVGGHGGGRWERRPGGPAAAERGSVARAGGRLPPP